MAEQKKIPVTVILSKAQVADALKSFLKNKLQIPAEKVQEIKWYSGAVVVLKS